MQFIELGHALKAIDAANAWGTAKLILQRGVWLVTLRE